MELNVQLLRLEAVFPISSRKYLPYGEVGSICVDLYYSTTLYEIHRIARAGFIKMDYLVGDGIEKSKLDASWLLNVIFEILIRDSRA